MKGIVKQLTDVLVRDLEDLFKFQLEVEVCWRVFKDVDIDLLIEELTRVKGEFISLSDHDGSVQVEKRLIRFVQLLVKLIDLFFVLLIQL